MRILLLFLVFCSSFTYAHNGKVTYSYQSTSKRIDAKTNDWQNENWVPISEYFGKPLEGREDLIARYKIAHCTSKNILYLITEINDDKFTEGDYYEFYLNGIHSKKAGGVASFIFRDKNLELRIHESQRDPIHASISKENIKYKTRKSGNKWIIEASFKLSHMLVDYKTIGIDHFIVDVDGEDGEKTYLNWGIGYNGFWKEYNSGQLGDVVLLPEKPDLNEVSGIIRFENEKARVQSTVRITNKNYPDLWIEVKLDSTGRFRIKLAEGDYYISPSYELTNPFAGDGYGNQLRTDIHFRHSFSIHNLDADLGKIEIPVFKEPNYMFEEEGIINSFSRSSTEEVDAFIKNQMNYYNVPGASIAVIKNGQVVYDEVFGVKSLLTGVPITKQTKFQAASVTKSVFAYIVNRLVDQGKFDLDSPLHTLLPFKNYENDDRYKTITGRNVLNHTTGMPNWAFGGPGGYISGTKGTLNFDPGTKFGYSGEAFEYLARVIEKVTGKGIEQLLKEEVIDPLGIPTIYFTGNKNLEFAQGHLQSNPTYWGGYATVPGVAHSMLTNATDFAQLLVALANRKGMSSEQYEAMFERDVLSPDFPTSPDFNYWGLGIGLGFFVQETVAGKAVMHGGSNYDFQSEFVLYPESKNGFVIFTNSNTGHKLGQALGKYLFYGGTKKPEPPN